MNKTREIIWICLVGTVLAASAIGWGAPMGTAFTYQGRLSRTGAPAEGEYDLQFELYDHSGDPCQGSLLGAITKNNLAVSDGFLTVQLDFGSDLFDGQARWLQISVRPGQQSDPCVYTTLLPRQELTPTPYALHTRGILVDSYGSVGIGNTSPAAKLDVDGHINSSQTYKLEGQTVLSIAGTDNILVGEEAGVNNTTAYNNSAVGYQSLYSNTTGYDNSAMGYQSLYTVTAGYRNTAMGSYALRYNTASYNTAMGYRALYQNTSGNYNSALGYGALFNNTTGSNNTAVGHYALHENTTGRNNVAMGCLAGDHNITGSRNIFLGFHAGYYETGSDKLYIDNSATSTPLIYGDFSTDQVGINRVPAANALEVEGDASKSTAGDWLANSDASIKTNVNTVTQALATLDKVRLVSFRYTDDYRDEHPGIKDRPYLNVIAQEFREVFPDYVQSSGEKLPSGREILQVDSYPLTIYSAAAVQELHSIVKAKDAEIADLKERVSKMEVLLNELLNDRKPGR